MDIITSLNLATAAELGITSLVVFAVTQAIKRTPIKNVWIPWISMGLGVIAGLIAVAATGESNYGGGAIAGLLVGGFVSGLFDGFKSASIVVTNRKDKVANLEATVSNLTAELEKLKAADKEAASTQQTQVAASDAASSAPAAESQEAK